MLLLNLGNIFPWKSHLKTAPDTPDTLRRDKEPESPQRTNPDQFFSLQEDKGKKKKGEMEE